MDGGRAQSASPVRTLSSVDDGWGGAAIGLQRRELTTACLEVQMCLHAPLVHGGERISYELLELDLSANQHRQPEFLAINPFGKPPVLVDSGVLTPGGELLTLLRKRRDSSAPGGALHLRHPHSCTEGSHQPVAAVCQRHVVDRVVGSVQS